MSKLIQPSPKGGHAAAIRALAFSPDQHFLASGDDLGWVGLWEVTQQRLRTMIRVPHWSTRRWPVHRRPRIHLPLGVEDLCFTTGGRRLVVALSVGVEIYDVESGSLERHFPKLQGPLTPDGMFFWAYEGDRLLKIDPQTGGWCEAFSLAPAQSAYPRAGLRVAFQENHVQGWDLAGTQLLWSWPVPPAEEAPHTHALSKDGRFLAFYLPSLNIEGSYCMSLSLMVLDVQSGRLQKLSNVDLGTPHPLLRWGEQLLFVSASHRVDRWDVSGFLVGSSPDSVTALALGAGIALGDAQGNLRFMGKDPRWFPPLHVAAPAIVDLAFADQLYSLHQDGVLRVWKGTVSTIKRCFWGKPLALHPEGLWVATVHQGQLWIWSVATALGHCIDVGAREVISAVFGGSCVALMTRDHQLWVWEVGEMHSVLHQVWTQDWVCALSRDGTQLALGSVMDGRIQLVQLATGEMQILAGERERRHGVANLRFSPDALRLAVGGVGAWAESWALDAIGGGQHFPLPADSVSVDINNSGDMVGALHYEPLLWLLRGERAQARFADQGNAGSVVFSPDGRQIAWALGDGMVRVIRIHGIIKPPP